MDPFAYRLTVRYMEADAQGVVFNGWYLTYFDEAMTAFLHARGLPYPALLSEGFDYQLVHAELDWKAGLRWPDDVRVSVVPEHVGRTSFTMGFATRRADGETTCTARVVYVVIAGDGSGKREIPLKLWQALTVEP